MTSRTLLVLAAALVVLALLAQYGQRGDSMPAETDQRVLPRLEAALADIDRVRVTGAGNETLATLERRADSWGVAQKQGYPADIGTLRAALRNLAEARIVEQKTSNSAYYERLGVEPVESEDAFGVELGAYAGDEMHAAVIIGDTAGSGLQYVRLSDADASYLVDREIEVPREAVGWIDPDILDIDGNRIASVTIEHPDGEVVRLTKTDAAQTSFTVEGIPEGRTLSYPGVANVVGNTLRGLQLEDVAAAEDELPETFVRTTFTTFDGLVVTATSFDVDGDQWVRFATSVAADSGAEATSAESGDPADGPGEGSAAAQDELGGQDAASAAADVADEASLIDARTAGWRYRLPSYPLEQLTRRMDDLLAAEEDEE